MRALLVEDSPTCIETGKATLVAHGYDVAHRTAASSARGTVARGSFALYVVDANIPESLYGKPGDGIGFVRWLRIAEPHARVIVWSADKGVKGRARALGATFAWKEDKDALARAVMGE